MTVSAARRLKTTTSATSRAGSPSSASPRSGPLHHRTSERGLAYGDVDAVRPHSGAMKPETIAADAKAAAA
jgi:hypothetical protein